jgi:solute carrier family 35 protein E3
VTFAAFHFAITALFLYAISRPRIGIFTAKRVPILSILPLALAMIPNVVLPNASLAYSSVQFYQVTRVLLTPCVALINYTLYRSQVSRHATLTLITVCIGVAVVIYFDTAPASEQSEKRTSVLGVFFALTGVLASSAYTILIKTYHGKLECTSHQLLLNQAPVSVLTMLYIIPFSDDVTVHGSTSCGMWGLILMVSGREEVGQKTWLTFGLQSAVFACLINLTQFIIIEEGGAVTSTVVGHFKTCVVITIGWIACQKPVTDGSMGGIVLAVGGIIA